MPISTFLFTWASSVDLYVTMQHFNPHQRHGSGLRAWLWNAVIQVVKDTDWNFFYARFKFFFSFLFLSDMEHLYWWRCLFFEIPGVLAKQVAFRDSKFQCLLALLLDNLLTAVLFITYNGCFQLGYSGSLMSSKSASVCVTVLNCTLKHQKSNGIFYVQKFCFEFWSLDACIYNWDGNAHRRKWHFFGVLELWFFQY